MITPIEIRQHTFRKKTLGGYDIEEVQQFLSGLSLEWEKLIEENRKNQNALDKLQTQYNSLKEVEGMLQKTLHQAEQSTKDTLENARKRASLIVNEAEANAREIMRQGVEQRNNIDREINELCERRDEILMQLHTFLKTQSDRLMGFGKKNKEHTTLTETLPKVETPDGLFNTSFSSNGESKSVDDIVEQL